MLLDINIHFNPSNLCQDSNFEHFLKQRKLLQKANVPDVIECILQIKITCWDFVVPVSYSLTSGYRLFRCSCFACAAVRSIQPFVHLP